MLNLKPILLGIVAGMRSMSAPAFTSLYLGRKIGARPSDRLTEIIASPEANLLLPALALGELVVDKLPFTPARIQPPSLLARIASGAITGQAVEVEENHDRVYGAFLGGLAAAGSTFSFYYLRRALARRSHIPDPVLGFLEDMLAIGLGVTLLNSDGRLG